MDSSTCVVNVRVAYLRPKYKNLREWCEDPQNVYIGRSGIVFIDGKRYPPVASPWENPFNVSQTLSRDEAILKYKQHVKSKFGVHFKEELEKLRGKRLGCWCKPKGCHGDLLLEFLEE